LPPRARLAYGGRVRKARDPISSLRTAIDCLPARTREAMLEGIRAHPIVVGAYTDSRGGICPMLAAHRHGGRTSFVSFARAWDQFARTRTIRRATERELRTLENLLVASLAEEEPTDLTAAIAEHRAAVERRRMPEILARSLTQGRLRLGQRDADDRAPTPRRANTSSPRVS
jgi:hypothetical protein